MRIDETHVVKHPGHAAHCPQLAGFEKHPNLRRGAVAVVGQTLHDDRDLVRGEPFVGDQFVVHSLAGQAGPIFNRTLDGIARHGLFLRGFDGGVQPRV